MHQRQIILSHLVPTNKNCPIAVEPTVCALYHPTPGFVAFLLLDGLGFLISTDNVGAVTPFGTIVTNYFAIIAFIQAQMLGLILSDWWPGYYNALVSPFKQFTVVAIDSGHHSQRRTTPVYPQAAFGADFSSVSGVWPGFFPHRVGL